MKGFIEVHCDKKPLLINIDRISGVQDNVYFKITMSAVSS